MLSTIYLEQCRPDLKSIVVIDNRSGFVAGQFLELWKPVRPTRLHKAIEFFNSLPQYFVKLTSKGDSGEGIPITGKIVSKVISDVGYRFSLFVGLDQLSLVGRIPNSV